MTRVSVVQVPDSVVQVPDGVVQVPGSVVQMPDLYRSIDNIDVPLSTPTGVARGLGFSLHHLPLQGRERVKVKTHPSSRNRNHHPSCL